MIIRNYHNFINESKNFCFSDKVCPFLWTKGAKDGDFLQAIYDIENCWYENGFNDDILMKMEKDFGVDFAILTLFGYYDAQVCNGGHAQYWDNGYASIESSGFANSHKDTGNIDYMVEHFKEVGLYTSELNKKIYGILEDAQDIFKIFAEGDVDCEECDRGEIEEDCGECENGYQLDNCDTCNGEGEIEVGEGEYKDCSECDGVGEVEIECRECGGDGKVHNFCEYCDGAGYVDPSQEYKSQINNLDTKYYKINEDWLDYLKVFAENLIKNMASKEEWEHYILKKNSEKYNL